VIVVEESSIRSSSSGGEEEDSLHLLLLLLLPQGCVGCNPSFYPIFTLVNTTSKAAVKLKSEAGVVLGMTMAAKDIDIHGNSILATGRIYISS